MTVAIVGSRALALAMNGLQKDLGKNTADALVAGAQLVRTAAIKSIQQQSPGEAVIRYRNGGSPIEHRASLPGDAPNTDTGTLVKSVVVEVNTAGVFVGVIRDKVRDYATFLEFGTSKMKARPWLLPARDKSAAQVRKLLEDAIEKTIRGA
jgi:HK97 gp10 family phage protein